MAQLPRVGDHFGRYRIDAQIGRGGMGVVFGATDLSFDRAVALKVVSAALGDSEDFRLRFEREASLLARIDSPHIIKIFDYGVEEGCPYIATQYVAGGDLGGLIQSRGSMPPTLAAGVCAQVADALDDAHRAGVVHRDVKPTNVLLRDADTHDLQAYLCDFGIARTANDGLTAPGLVAGTWSYLAPECGKGAPGTPASDIYALGCLFWATLTGQPPFRGSDIEVAIAHQNAPVPQLEGHDQFTERANAILRGSLAKESDQRYPSADQMRQDLLAAAALPSDGVRPVYAPAAPTGATPLPSGAPVGSSAHPSFGSMPPTSMPTPMPTTLPTTSAPSRQRRTTLVALAAVAVLVIAGGVFGLTRLGGDGGGEPSADPTESTGSPQDGVERLDEGGPITTDLTGDGFGDAYTTFRRQLTRDGKQRYRVGFDRWRSTGTSLEFIDAASVPGNPGTFRMVVAGDFDGDELLDQMYVSISGLDSPILIESELSGGTTLEQEVPQPETGTVAESYVGDVDDDGDDDLVVVTYPGDTGPFQFSTLLFDGEEFSDPTASLEVPYGFSTARVELGDVDGDGMLDVLVKVQVVNDDTFAVQDRMEVYRGDGEVFGPEVGSSVVFDSDFGIDFLTADLDGDEDDEIVATLGEPTFITLRVLDWADGELGAPTPWGVLSVESGQASDTGVGISDVNGDGLDDVLGFSPSRQSDEAFVEAALSNGETFAPPERFTTWDRNLNGRGGPEPLGYSFP